MHASYSKNTAVITLHIVHASVDGLLQGQIDETTMLYIGPYSSQMHSYIFSICCRPASWLTIHICTSYLPCTHLMSRIRISLLKKNLTPGILEYLEHCEWNPALQCRLRFKSVAQNWLCGKRALTKNVHLLYYIWSLWKLRNAICFQVYAGKMWEWY